MKKLKIVAGLALVAVLALGIAAPALAERVRYGTMMVDNCEEWVSLRDGPGTGCGRLAKVPLYAIVTDAEWDSIWGDFIYCNYDGQYGYILSRYLIPWADPEPEGEARFDSPLGFSFAYDAGVFSVDADSSEDGQGLTLYPAEGDVPVYLEIMTGESLGVSLDRFMEVNAPADAAYETDETEYGARMRSFPKPADYDRSILQVFYAVEDGDRGVAVVGTCPSAGGEAWLARFGDVVRSIAFESALPLRVDWAEATTDVLVVDQDGDYVTIMADESVSDVALLALELTDFDEDGNVAFDTDVLCEQDALRADEHLVVKIAFYGDVPGYGIRLTDAAGEVRQFAIGISGRDGELMLTEF
ncbi:MAG: hypothetical protein Q4C10_14830 [Clostridia bacterium]|nr:hypothetical protein [Clostridia bacterium]